jgi:hypothetical protein
MDKDKTFDIPGFKHIESKECDRYGDDDDQQPSTSRGTLKKKRSGLYGGTAVFKNRKTYRALVARPVPRRPIPKYSAFSSLQDVN